MIKYRKQKAYRARMREQGLCPHCGTLCAPYAECEERRIYKRQHRISKRLLTNKKIYKKHSTHNNQPRPSRRNFVQVAGLNLSRDAAERLIELRRSKGLPELEK